MNSTPRLQRLEFVYVSVVAASARHLMLRPEQKSLVWMMDSVAKFSGPKEQVVDFCAGTLAVAKACLFCLSISALQEAKRMKVVSKKLYHVYLRFTRYMYVLSSESHLQANEGTFNAVLVFLAEMAGIQARNMEDILSKWSGVPLAKSYPQHVFSSFHRTTTSFRCFKAVIKAVAIFHRTVDLLRGEGAFTM